MVQLFGTTVSVHSQGIKVPSTFNNGSVLWSYNANFCHNNMQFVQSGCVHCITSKKANSRWQGSVIHTCFFVQQLVRPPASFETFLEMKQKENASKWRATVTGRQRGEEFLIYFFLLNSQQIKSTELPSPNWDLYNTYALHPFDGRDNTEKTSRTQEVIPKVMRPKTYHLELTSHDPETLAVGVWRLTRYTVWPDRTVIPSIEDTHRWHQDIKDTCDMYAALFYITRLVSHATMLTFSAKKKKKKLFLSISGPITPLKTFLEILLSTQ